MSELPVARELNRIVAAAESGAVVVTAPPGSGKTTLVPSAIMDSLAGEHRRVILVQPRRLAARSVASWIAKLRGSQLGNEVGYQVRFDRCISAATKLSVVTTGVLLRRFQDDPFLDGVGAVVLDEFHERSLEMDLALGMLVRLRQTVRDDLQVCVMSATLNAEPVAKLLGDCPIVVAEGRRFPVDIRFAKLRDNTTLDQQVLRASRQAIDETSGHVLVFLPGVGEIKRCERSIEQLAAKEHMSVHTLYGDLPPEQQDAVLGPTAGRKLILATNVAETSVTIDGVTAVIDSGLARQFRFSQSVGLPRLELTPISQASAEQRAGRAGRTAPGICWRLWESASHGSRPVVDLPEVYRQDLAEAVLQLCCWGESDFLQFPWLSPPTVDALQSATKLLRSLDVIDNGNRITSFGWTVARLPTHPRLAVLIISGARLGALDEATLAAALLSERDPFRTSNITDSGTRDRIRQISESDIGDRVTALQNLRGSGRTSDEELTCHPNAARPIFRAADQLAKFVRDRDLKDLYPESSLNAELDADTALRRSLLDAFPDRVIKLRSDSSDRGVMVGGKGVRLDVSSRVRSQSLILGLDIYDASGDARVRMASAINRDWLTGPGLRTADEVFFHPTRQQVEARRRTYWFDLLLEEATSEIVNHQEAAELLAKHARLNLEKVMPSGDSPAGQFRQRVRWLSSVASELELPDLSDEHLLEHLPQLCDGLRSLAQLRAADWLSFMQNLVGYQRLAEIDRLAPKSIEVPSGNRFTLEYAEGQTPVLAVRIQELFGLAATPRIAGGRVAVLLHLLGPNFRPQQVTCDLASFWDNTYPQIKKELRRRYPKHAWPDDPKSATPSKNGLNRPRSDNRP